MLDIFFPFLTHVTNHSPHLPTTTDSSNGMGENSVRKNSRIQYFRTDSSLPPYHSIDSDEIETVIVTLTKLKMV